MAHRLHSTDCGDSCLTCGADFHCGKCSDMSEAGSWQDHECEAEALADFTPCDESDVCHGTDGDVESAHHWSAALPRDWRSDDPTTHRFAAECDFCGVNRAVEVEPASGRTFTVHPA